MSHSIRVATYAAMAIGLLSVTPVAAQSDAETVPGVKFGLNIANLVENGEAVSSRSGLVLGGFVRQEITDNFAIQPEVLFSQQGGAFQDVAVRLTYLQIPVLGIYRFPGQQVRAFIGSGLALGLKLGASVSVDGESEDLGDDVAGGDVSFVIGGGVERERLIVEVRYMLGARDVDTGRDITKNRVLSVMAGISLGSR